MSDLNFAERIGLTAALFFLVSGLITGAWKYVHIHRSPAAEAPNYVNIAHRASLLYSGASLLLTQLAMVSRLSSTLEAIAMIVPLAFFTISIASYVVHGLLRDTDNQLLRPHKLGKAQLPDAVMSAFMWSLIVGEIGGTLVLGGGAMITLWSP